MIRSSPIPDSVGCGAHLSYDPDSQLVSINFAISQTDISRQPSGVLGLACADSATSGGTQRLENVSLALIDPKPLDLERSVERREGRDWLTAEAFKMAPAEAQAFIPRAKLYVLFRPNPGPEGSIVSVAQSEFGEGRYVLRSRVIWSSHIKLLIADSTTGRIMRRAKFGYHTVHYPF